MNLSCGSATIKYLIFTFNFFFVITGIILISVGATIHGYYTQYNFFLNSQYFSLPNLLIATGSLIFIICFLGCWGAIKNSWIMLFAFSVLLGIIFIFEFSAGIAGYVLRDKTTRYLEDSMRAKMEEYKNENSTSAYMWDLIQNNYQCCGVINYQDWSKYMVGDALPISCCPPKQGQSAVFYCNAAVYPPSSVSIPSTTTNATTTIKPPSPTPPPSAGNGTRGKRDAQNVPIVPTVLKAVPTESSTTEPYRNGCEYAFGQWVKAHAVDIGAVCFTLAVLQLIGIGFSCHLSKQLKNSYYST